MGHRHEIALLPGPHFHPQSAISYETVTPDTATAPITVSIRIPAENQCQKHDTRTDRNPGPFSLVAMRWTRTAVRKRSEVLRPCTGGGPLQFSTITTRTVDHCNKQSTTAVAVAEFCEDFFSLFFVRLKVILVSTVFVNYSNITTMVELSPSSANIAIISTLFTATCRRWHH